LQIAPFDPTKKKKKKKVTVIDPADVDDESVDKLTEKTENLSGM
jgi:translation initiation factor 2 subunit 2